MNDINDGPAWGLNLQPRAYNSRLQGECYINERGNSYFSLTVILIHVFFGVRFYFTIQARLLFIIT